MLTLTFPRVPVLDRVVVCLVAATLTTMSSCGRNSAPAPVPSASAPPAALSNSIGVQFVLVPAGELTMGGDQSPEVVARNLSYEGVTHSPSDFVSEHPQHRVRISKPFYLSAHEVTQAQWEALTGENPSGFAPTGGWRNEVAGQDTSQFPVENMTWYDAVDFCNRLSRKENLAPYYETRNVQSDQGRITRADVTVAGGVGYRLPTEAEWEYACRAGTTTAFHFGDTCSTDDARVHTSYPEVAVPADEWSIIIPTTTVGSFAPNQFGLYDMSGNVAEWCFDCYDANAYAVRGELTVDPVVSCPVAVPSRAAAAAPADPDDEVPTGHERVFRGGDAYHSVQFARSACRAFGSPGGRDAIGLRLARTAP